VNFLADCLMLVIVWFIVFAVIVKIGEALT